MELQGKVVLVGKTEQVSEKFSKRQLVVEYAENPTYPETVAFELQQDKTALADKLKAGDEVTVHFNLRGRPWTDKTGKTSYFNTLSVWRIESATKANTPAYATAGEVEEENSDLPF